MLHSSLLGVFIVFLYDIIRIFRKVIKHTMFLIAAEDFVYWIACSILIFLMMYRENDGVIRWFSVAGVVFGMLVYNYTISPFFTKWISFLLNRIIRGIGKILGFLFKPFRFLLKKAASFFSFLFKKERKAYKFIKKQLKKLGKTVKIVISRH